jgi:hypothetical protein
LIWWFVGWGAHHARIIVAEDDPLALRCPLEVKVRAQSKMARTRADFGRLSKRCKKRWTEWWSAIRLI